MEASSHTSELVHNIVENQKLLINYCRRRLKPRDRHLAEDMAQEALCKEVKRADTFKGRSKLSTWLITIAKNTIIDFYRRKKRNMVVDVDQDICDLSDQRQLQTGQDNYFQVHRSTEDQFNFRISLKKLLTGLTPNERRLLMAYLKYDHKGACKVLETKEGTFKSRRFRVLLRLNKVRQSLGLN